MRLLFMLLGIIGHSDYYNTQPRVSYVKRNPDGSPGKVIPRYPGVPMLQLLYLRYIKRVSKGKLYNIIPWGYTEDIWH